MPKRVLAAVGLRAAGDQHDEAGQVLVLGAQAVGDPRAQRRPARAAASPVKTSNSAGAWLNWSVCIEWMKQSSSATSARCGTASESQRPALPCCLKVRGVPSSLGVPEVKAKRLPLVYCVGAGLTVALDQLRLVVEQVEIRRRAGQVDIDHPLRLGGEMRSLGGQRIIDRRRGRRRGGVRCIHCQ